MSKPNPGSKEAVKQGCTCPIYDNSFGKGYIQSGDFWIDEKCPVHAYREKSDS